MRLRETSDMPSKAVWLFLEINRYEHGNYWYIIDTLYAQYFDAFQAALQNYVQVFLAILWKLVTL